MYKDVAVNKFLIILLLALSPSAYAMTECVAKVSRYFVGTSEVNQDEAHLWVNFESGGSASVSSKSAAYNSMLSAVISALVSQNTVKVRYFKDGADCTKHNSDWVGIWVYRK
ncbi:hypothetical protein AAOGI_41230 [Agarivorans albus]